MKRLAASPITSRMTRTHRISRIGSRAEMTAPGGTVGARRLRNSSSTSTTIRSIGITLAWATALRRAASIQHAGPARSPHQRRSSSDFSTAEDRLGQRNRCGYYGSRTNIPCRMSLPGGVLDQPCVSRPETTQRPVAQTDFQLAGHHDDVLTPRGRMPVQKGSGRLFSKYNKLSRLRFG
jgi:hypothetical protein